MMNVCGSMDRKCLSLSLSIALCSCRSIRSRLELDLHVHLLNIEWLYQSVAIRQARVVCLVAAAGLEE